MLIPSGMPRAGWPEAGPATLGSAGASGPLKVSAEPRQERSRAAANHDGGGDTTACQTELGGEYNRRSSCPAARSGSAHSAPGSGGQLSAAGTHAPGLAGPGRLTQPGSTRGAVAAWEVKRGRKRGQGGAALGTDGSEPQQVCPCPTSCRPAVIGRVCPSCRAQRLSSADRLKGDR